MFFKKKSILDDISIASPCPVKWDQMQGDEKIRFCSLCELNIYNISLMTRKEAEVLLEAEADNICLRMYRRKDGTLITKDCPIGKRLSEQFQNKVRKVATVMIALLSSFTHAFAQDSAKSQKTSRVEGPKDSKLFPPSEITIVDGRPCIKQDISTSIKRSFGESGPENSARDAFKAASDYEKNGKFEQALASYGCAITTFRDSKIKYDNVFASTVAKRYAQLLRKQNYATKAVQIEKEFCSKKK